MRGQHPLLERCSVESTWLAAVFSVDQRTANRVDLSAAFLLASDKVADVFAVVGVVPSINLNLDPVVLPVSQGDCFFGSHAAASGVIIRCGHQVWSSVKPVVHTSGVSFGATGIIRGCVCGEEYPIALPSFICCGILLALEVDSDERLVDTAYSVPDMVN